MAFIDTALPGKTTLITKSDGKTRHSVKKLLVISVLLAAIPVLAQTQNSRDGIAAFNAGEYGRALALFEQAEQTGNDSDALQYNIAVSLYRLGRYGEAREHFDRLADKPEWHVLVEYNLGLVAEAQQDNVAAGEYFERSASQNENEKVRTLALQKIQMREQQSAVASVEGRSSAPVAPKRWASLITVSAGTDSNASSLADEILESASSAEDSFHELLLYGHWQLSGRQGDGFRVYGLGFDRAFNTFDNLDSQVIGIGGVYEKPLGRYQFESGLRATRTLLDSEQVADQAQLSVGISRRFDFGTLSGSYALSHFDAGSDFGQIEGDQQQIDVGWRKQIGAVSLRGRYRYELNSREDLQRGGAFASYSPERHGVRLEARWQATPAWSTGIIAEHIHSRYDGTNRLRDTDGSIRNERRVNDQSRFSADVSYRFNSNWRAKAEYQYTDQRDNFDIYAYDKNRVLGTIEFQF